MPSLSPYDVGKKIFEGRTYEDDINATRAAMWRLCQPIAEYNDKARRQHLPVYAPEMHLALGNHEYRIIRAINLDRKLEGTLKLADLGYEEMGWTVHPFLEPFVIDGVAYCHYFPSGPKSLPIGKAAKLLSQFHMSCVAGHLPGRDIAYCVHGEGRPMTAIIAGSFYMHDEDYVIGPQKHWRGFYMLHEVVNGSFDEMAVSLNYLARKAEKEGWK